MANFKKLTRYTGGIVSKDRSRKDFLILRNTLELEQSDGDIFVIIDKEVEKRPDLIAERAYGIPDLWWVIYEFNEIKDPMFELKAGQIIRIPELQRVLDSIEALNN